jgi:D-aminopeptidase
MPVVALLAVFATLLAMQQPRPRCRQAGVVIGRLPAGPDNAITDVTGVKVGHTTLIQGDGVRTGVTVVLPHDGNPFQEKVPAALVVGNGYGKLAGATQLMELGELESPIALTNTLSVPRVADALLGFMLALPGNEAVKSLNVVVGETNDGGLNDIRGRHVGEAQLVAALRAAKAGPVEEGSVGAGTGTQCLGFKGGIGTSSRQVADYTVGVLVQSNFGGTLEIPGFTLELDKVPRSRREPGSCMIVVATDAPLDRHDLQRLGKRALAGMARTGASFSNGSGDYVIAFSTAKELRIPAKSDQARVGGPWLRNDRLTPLFVAVADATQEAILNSLFRATTVTSRFGTAAALPIDKLKAR